MEVDEQEQGASSPAVAVAAAGFGGSRVAGPSSKPATTRPAKKSERKQQQQQQDGPGRGRRRGGDKKGGQEEDGEPTLEEQLARSPYDYDLHLQHIQSAATPEEREQARSLMSEMMALREEDWMTWINDKKQQEGASLEGKVEVLELYKRACADLLSVKIHSSYASYVLELYFSARGYAYPAVLSEGQPEPGSSSRGAADSSTDNDGSATVFDEDFVDGEMAVALGDNVRWHLTEGQEVWRLLHDYELFLVRGTPTPQAIDKLEALYLQRLAEPHMQISETHQLFSEFVSQYRSDSYETTLVQAQPIISSTKALIEPREPMEDALSKSHSSEKAYVKYLSWEQEVKKPNLPLLLALLSRALASHPYSSYLWKQSVLVQARAIERPTSFAQADLRPCAVDGIVQLCHRASRFCPFDGDLISSNIRKLESLVASNVVASFGQAQFARTLEAEDSRLDLENFVQISTAVADVVRHSELDVSSQGPSEALVNVLETSIERVKTLTKGKGDPQLRLERYLMRQYERVGATESLSALWASLSVSYPQSAAVLVTRADYLQRNNDVDTARKLYASCGKKRYDYPEYVFDAWINFEHRDGTPATLQKALDITSHEMTFVQRRRMKEMQEEQLRLASQADASALAQPPIDAGQAPAGGGKRSAEDSLQEEAALMDEDSTSKRAKPEVDDGAELKRDRENAAVAITGLAPEVDDAALLKLFKDCGQVRDVKIRNLGGQAVATVEFMTRDQVPAALTKDKKRVGDREIGVAPVWQSTLYVANFPESCDAADIQTMFEPYGAIFETRWPSRRFKSTRRFVYIQYIDPASAQRALILHNTEVEAGSGQRLQVLISNPSRKQVRTDANVTKRELYITGLPKQTTEDDLTKLFSSFGALKSCRILKDDTGACKGVAFVDFDTEQSASAALSMNNYEFKKRRMAVVLADSKVAHKPKPTASGLGTRTDARNRTIRAIGLPQGAQEPLVQQAFDRHGRTTSLHIQGNVATVTFENPADAAQLLLLSEPFVFDGHQLTLKEDVTGHRKPPAGEGRQETDSIAAFLPRAGRGRGKKLGIGAGRSVGKATEALSTGMQSVEPGSTAPEGASQAISGRNQEDFRAMLLG